MTPKPNLILSQRVAVAAAGRVAAHSVAPAAVKRLPPAVMKHLLVRFFPILVKQQHLPVADTRSGNLFEDRSDAALRWYLADYRLLDSTDASFGFSATQTGEPDINGNPFRKATLTLSLKKETPQEAIAFQAEHTGHHVREIPLHISSATLTTTSRDPTTGQPKKASYPGTVAISNDGSLRLTFDNIKGPGVVVLYQNLKVNGSADIQLFATFDVVHRGQPQPEQFSYAPIRFLSPLSTAAMTHFVMLRERGRLAAPIRTLHPPPPHPALPHPPVHTPAPPSYTRGTLPYSPTLSLGTVFAANSYQLKFTISGPSGSWPILGVEDLKSFTLKQTEFEELKSLGDISARYPSLSRAYLGRLSKTIVVIPARYAIARGEDGCFATCLALLDSGPTTAVKCKFEFTFDLMPDVSPIEFLQLSQEIAEHSDLKDYAPKLPDFLADQPPATLATVFQSSFRYSSAGQPHMFSLSVELRDQDLGSPAVNNANLLLSALSVSKQPFLTGTIGLKLDDDYPSPVQSSVVLSFTETSGTDELSFSVDESSKTIRLENHSSLDLAISRYALGVQNQITVIPFRQTLAASNSATVPLPADHAGIAFAVDAELAVPAPMTKSDLQRYLTIGVQDVADTQFSFSVNASGIDFTGRQIDKIDVQITFASLPQLTPAPFSLNKLHTVDGTVIQVPIEHAITELDGTALFTIHFIDAQKPTVKFTKQNDFCSQAILVVGDSDVPNN